MKVFVSYAREDRQLAEKLNAALNAAGFDTFLDTKDLPPGQEFNARIKAAVNDSDVFIFLVSQDSVNPGSYTLTELAFAETKWRNPAGYVLPVITNAFDPGNLPTYLRPINALIIRGNLEAEVVGWVQERAAGGGGGFEMTIEDRLTKWARLSQPPIRKVRRRVPGSSIGAIIGGVFTIVFGLFFMDKVDYVTASRKEHFPGKWDLVDQIFLFVPYVLFLIGLALIIFAVFRALQGLRGGVEPVAAAVLDREVSEHGVTLSMQMVDGKRLRLEPVTRAARNVYSGELGWAYVSGSLLLDFIAASSQSVSDSQVKHAHANKRVQSN